MSSNPRKNTFSHRILRPVYNFLKRNSKDGSGQVALAFFCLICLYKVSLVYSIHLGEMENPGISAHPNKEDQHHARVGGGGKLGSFSSSVLDPNSDTKLRIQGRERIRDSDPSPNSPIPRRHHHEHYPVSNGESSRFQTELNRNSIHRHSFQHASRVARNIRPPLSPPPPHKEDEDDDQEQAPRKGSMRRGKKRTTTTTPPPQTLPTFPTSPSIILPVTTEFLPTPSNKVPVCYDLCKGGMGGLLCDCDILPIG